MKKRNIKGFTLAEVLITLTIIGVIAAITIPTLMQKHFEHEMINKLKKNYSVLSDAYTQAMRENGDPTDWIIDGNANTYTAAKSFTSYISPYLKIQRDCTNNPCFADSYSALFASKSYWQKINAERTTKYYEFMLEDGTALAIYTSGSGCITSTIGYAFEKGCAGVMVDLNGKKKPNKFGVDIFYLVFTEKNVVPYGVGIPQLKADHSSQCTYMFTGDGNGVTCGAHAFYKGNMDYLRRDISKEW